MNHSRAHYILFNIALILMLSHSACRSKKQINRSFEFQPWFDSAQTHSFIGFLTYRWYDDGEVWISNTPHIVEKQLIDSTIRFQYYVNSQTLDSRERDTFWLELNSHNNCDTAYLYIEFRHIHYHSESENTYERLSDTFRIPKVDSLKVNLDSFEYWLYKYELNIGEGKCRTLYISPELGIIKTYGEGIRILRILPVEVRGYDRVNESMLLDNLFLSLKNSKIHTRCDTGRLHIGKNRY